MLTRLRTAALLACLAIVVSLLLSAPALATFRGENGKIAAACSGCVKDENGVFGSQGELALFDPAGAQPPVLVPRGKSFMPSWSPDGQSLIYKFAGSVADRISVAFGPALVSNYIGGGGGGIGGLAYSPDGRQVFFSAHDYFAGTDGVDDSGFFLAPTDGGDPVKLVSTAPVDTARFYGRGSWSPGGHTVLAASSATQAIHAINTRNGHERRLIDGASPDWAPHGRAFTFERTSGDNTDIYVAYTLWPGISHVFAVRRLTRNPASDESPTWSPDGRSIAFVSRRDGHREIYVMRADGRHERRVTHSVEDADYGWPGMSELAWQPLPRD